MLLTLEDLQSYINRIPANQYMHLQLKEIGEGYSKVKMPYNPVFINSWKNTHGAALMTLTDLTFFVAIATLNGLDISGSTSTSEIKINFLRPTNNSDLYAEANIIKNGKRNVFGEVSIKNTTGKLITYSTVTYVRA